jgi:hypothetical protein
MEGLVPQSAFVDSALHYLQVMGFTLEDTVEQRLDSILGDGAQGWLPVATARGR